MAERLGEVGRPERLDPGNAGERSPVRFLILLTFIFQSVLLADVLTVYSYDSFSGKGTLGEFLTSEFEEDKKDTLRIVSFGSAGEALNQISIEGEKTPADAIIGVDNSLLPWALSKQHFAKIEQGILPKGMKIKATESWIPYDYGYLAFVYNRLRFKTALPPTLQEISQEKLLAKKVVVLDPRTSSLGRLFLVWTLHEVGAKGFDVFWKGFSKNLLTIAPGWSGAYSLFTKNEADLVLSYSTSPAYHIEFEKSDAVKAIIFPTGHARQIEGLLVTKYSKKNRLIKKLIEHLLGERVQSKIPLTNFMYPIMSGIKLPAAFSALGPEPLSIDLEISSDLNPLISRWVATQ